MSLTIVKNATCTFCGCVCDDIELHADGERIVKTKTRLQSSATRWFKNHTAEQLYPDALIDGKEATVDEAVEAAADYPLQRQHAAGLRPEQHHLRGAARGGRAGRADRRRDRQPHLALTRSHRDRRPVGWQGHVHAGRSQEPGRLHHLLGRQPGRVPSAALHQVHAHAEGQVRAQRPQGPHDGAGGHPRDAERQGRRHLPAGPARQGLRGAHHPAGPDQGPAGRPRAASPRPA